MQGERDVRRRVRILAVLRLYGCGVTTDDTRHLVSALTAYGSAASLEAAAAIRWGAGTKVSVTDLEPELRRAILRVLEDPSPGLVELREALIRAEGRQPKAARVRRRFHNPRRRECGCLDDCWCKRTRWGRIVRWYVPPRHHTSVSPCWHARDGDRPRTTL